MEKFSETTRKYIDSKDEVIHISGSGAYSFETEGHGVVRQELKVNAISGKLTVTSKDGTMAGSCSHSLGNDFSQATAPGSQRKVNACDEWIDYAFTLAAPDSRVGSVVAASENTSTGTISASGTMSASDVNAYDVAISCKTAGNVGSRVPATATAGESNTTSTTATVSGSLGSDDVSGHVIVLKVHTAGDTAETSVPIDVTIDGEAQEQASLSSSGLAIELSLGLTVTFTTASFVKDDTWTVNVEPCPVLAVVVNDADPEDVVVKSNGQTSAIDESGVSLSFASGDYIKDDSWSLELKGISVDAELVISAV